MSKSDQWTGLLIEAARIGAKVISPANVERIEHGGTTMASRSPLGSAMKHLARGLLPIWLAACSSATGIKPDGGVGGAAGSGGAGGAGGGTAGAAGIDAGGDGSDGFDAPIDANGGDASEGNEVITPLVCDDT